MQFSISSILCSIFFSAIGLWVLREGKRKADFKILGIGLALMVFPYFTPNAWADWGVGIGLCALAYIIW